MARSAEQMPAGKDDARHRWNRRYEAKWRIGGRDHHHQPEPVLLVADEPAALARLLTAVGLSLPGDPISGPSDPDHAPSGPGASDLSQGQRPPLAIDLAGGDGHGAVALALRGFETVLVDVSDVALEVAERRAAAAGVSITTVLLDLQSLTLGQVLDEITRLIPDIPAPAEKRSGSEPGLLITCTHYLNRPLLRSVPHDLPSGAIFAAAIATVRNLERNQRPSARFLLDPGDLALLLAGSDPGYTVLHQVEHWTPEGTNEAEIVVGRTAS